MIQLSVPSARRKPLRRPPDGLDEAVVRESRIRKEHVTTF